MTVHPSGWLAWAAVTALFGIAACGSNEPAGTTPVCKEADAADCFTYPDGGLALPDAAQQQEAAPGDDAATAD